MTVSQPLRAIALMGATGSGKSALAMQFAAEYDSSIISCDSVQIYKGLDIGSAKPNYEEQQQVKHTLIDCTDIHNIWSARTWAKAAEEIILEENQKGITPMIVGGTGMYLKALIEGFAEIPEEKEGIREVLEAIAQEKGTPYLHAQLAEADATLAERLESNDTQRIIRGLSVYQSTGTPLSEWHKNQEAVKKDTAERVHCPVFVLEVERDMLRERIALRFQQMMDAGFLEEVLWLQSQNLPHTHPVMRAVGYRQLLEHLEGKCSLEQAVEDGITATRRYAKRQRTWFRNQTPGAMRGDAAFLYQMMSEHLQKNND